MDHHDAAIRMSQVCEQKANHAQVREECENIIASQQKETQQMQSWLKQWYNVDYTPQLAAPYQQLVTFLGTINGDTFEVSQFDLWFMQNMDAHHQIAINRSEECLQKASHEQLKDMCQQTISSQKSEIAQDQSWLCQWYNLCEEHK